MIWRWLPLAGVVVFLGVVGWRSWWQRRRYGTRRVLLFQSPRWQDNLRDALGVVLVVLLLAQAIMAARGLTSEGSGHLFDHPVDDVRHVGGTALLFGGLALLVVALLDLGVSWRIGIEEGSRSGLVTSGLYRFCRNPIFAAILIMVAGYALLLPTRLSLLLLVGAFIGIRQQALAEEAYLLRTHGDAYRAYARRVGRFLPGVGKLR
jgi:protein-S-isoprenylcysteine O-methyltransferase Ste14